MNKWTLEEVAMPEDAGYGYDPAMDEQTRLCVFLYRGTDPMLSGVRITQIPESLVNPPRGGYSRHWVKWVA